MSFLSSIFDIGGKANSSLFGNDQEVNDSGQNTNKKTTDSGQNKTSTSVNSGQKSIQSGGDTTSADYQNSSTSSTTFNSGRTDISQLLLTPDAVESLLKSLLSGTQGLAAVSSGQKQAGLYDSTTNELLTNDLLTRVTGDVAARAAQQVNTIGSSTSTTNQSTSNYADQTVSRTPLINTTGPSTSTVSDIVGQRVIDETAAVSPRNISTDQKGLLDNLGWIICTELRKQGKMNFRNYVFGSEKFKEYNEEIKQGYYIWAEPSVKHLRKYPNSIYSKFLAIWFNARAKYIVAQEYHNSDLFKVRRTLLGFVSYYATHVFCWLLSKTLARKYSSNWRELYEC